MGKYHVSKSKHDQYFWNLRAGNGEKILQSEMYKEKQGALAGIESCKKSSADAKNYEKLVSKKEEPYFVLRAGNNEVIGTSEMYSSVQARDNGIESCIKNGPGADTKDDTGA
ncbi:YegP family protein [Candidatus Sumerlaeota bacterium]|nr:YegP family protein [Candidatus Sumerlaeota bacterium]